MAASSALSDPVLIHRVVHTLKPLNNLCLLAETDGGGWESHS
jgi:hypothetical protein